MKAMLLAAGRGERMRPLTDTLPKPLLSVGSKTLIEHNLEKLKAAGIADVVINVSYLANQIMDQLGDGSRFGMQITYSEEPTHPLGTGGGIFQALPFLGDEPFLLLSSDIWTDFKFETLNVPLQGDAHLVLVDNPDFHPEGDYGLLGTGLLSLQHLPKFTYANIAIIHPRLFQGCSADIFSLAPVLEKAINRSAVTGQMYHGEWYNVGTPKELKKLK